MFKFDITITIHTVFELGLAGKEIPLDNDKIKFDNYISTLALQQSIESGLPIFPLMLILDIFQLWIRWR